MTINLSSPSFSIALTFLFMIYMPTTQSMEKEKSIKKRNILTAEDFEQIVMKNDTDKNVWEQLTILGNNVAGILSQNTKHIRHTTDHTKDVDFFSLLPAELHLTIVKNVLPTISIQQLKALKQQKKWNEALDLPGKQAEKLVETLKTLTALAQVNHTMRAIIQNNEIKKAFIRSVYSYEITYKMYSIIKANIISDSSDESKKEPLTLLKSYQETLMILLKNSITLNNPHTLVTMQREEKEKLKNCLIFQIADINPNYCMCSNSQGEFSLLQGAITFFKDEDSNSDLISELISKGASVNQENDCKNTVLTTAIQRKETLIVLELLEIHKAVLRKKDLEYITPSHNPLVVKTVCQNILEGKARITLKDEQQKTLEKALEENDTKKLADALRAL